MGFVRLLIEQGNRPSTCWPGSHSRPGHWKSNSQGKTGAHQGIHRKQNKLPFLGSTNQVQKAKPHMSGTAPHNSKFFAVVELRGVTSNGNNFKCQVHILSSCSSTGLHLTILLFLLALPFKILKVVHWGPLHT